MIESLRAIGVTITIVLGPDFEDGGLGWDPLVLQLDAKTFPFRAPPAWCPTITFFELAVDTASATFCAPFTSTAPAWLCAAAVAVTSCGKLRDPQTGETFEGSNLAAMLYDINEARPRRARARSGGPTTA